jgi:hypothetical protein
MINSQMGHIILKNLPEERPCVYSKFATIASFPVPLVYLCMVYNLFPKSIKSVDDTAALNQLVTIIFKLYYIYCNTLVLKEYYVNMECKKSLKIFVIGAWK